VKTLLFIGAGRHQRRAIAHARGRELRVVAVDRNEGAPGFAEADVAEVVDFLDVERVVEAGRRHAVDGVVTVAAERAVPVVAAVAEALGLPGIGTDVAHVMTHKVAQRRLLGERGLAQPRFAAVRTLHEARLAVDVVGFPAVLKPADSAGQRGLFRLDSVADLERRLYASLAESPTHEAILESFHEGLEVNALVVARGGEATVVTLSDRLRPRGRGFGVACLHVYPSSLYGDALEEAERVAASAVAALGLREGIGYPQLLATDDGVLVVEVAARVPGGQMAEVARHGVGVDVVDVAIRLALGEEVPDELVTPRFQQPLAIRFLTADPGPLPPGTVRAVSGLDRVLEAPGVVEADVYLVEGETIRPVERDGDRRGFVIAVAETNVGAVERAESAARLLEVEIE
jgi:biotin carboxylase